MIIRVMEKLGRKIKESPGQYLPPAENPYLDWTANLFYVNRNQYVIVTNTKSLYSIVMHGQGICDSSSFIDYTLGTMRDFMKDDDNEFIFRRFIGPGADSIEFSKTGNRSVTGSMNDLVSLSKHFLLDDSISPYDVFCKINQVPFKSLGFKYSSDVSKAMLAPNSDE